MNHSADFKSRIDRFYLTTNMEINCKIRTQIIQNYLSDHQIITSSIHKKKRKEKKTAILEIKFQYLGKQRLQK